MCGMMRSGAAWYGSAWCGRARFGRAWYSIAWEVKIMPKSRQSREIWKNTTRPKVWQRDRGRCQGPYCTDKPEWSIALETCHIDHVKSGKLSDNRLDNLERATHRENLEHAVKTGLRKPQASKYSPEKINEILELREKGLSQFQIGMRLGVNPGMVYLVLSGYRTKYRTVKEMRAAIGSKDLRGIKHPMAVLSEEDVRQIKKKLNGGISAYEIFNSRIYPVSYPSIHNIKHGKTWRHISG